MALKKFSNDKNPNSLPKKPQKSAKSSSTTLIKLMSRTSNLGSKWWKNLFKITKHLSLSVTLWCGATLIERLRKTLHILWTNKMQNKAANQKSKRKKHHKMHNKMSKTMVNKQVNQKKSPKTKRTRWSKNRLSIHFGKMWTINRVFLCRNTSTSSKSKTRFLPSNDKMLRFSSFVRVSFTVVGRIPFIRFSRLPGFRNQLNCSTLERVKISYRQFIWRIWLSLWLS